MWVTSTMSLRVCVCEKFPHTQRLDLPAHTTRRITLQSTIHQVWIICLYCKSLWWDTLHSKHTIVRGRGELHVFVFLEFCYFRCHTSHLPSLSLCLSQKVNLLSLHAGGVRRVTFLAPLIILLRVLCTCIWFFFHFHFPSVVPTCQFYLGASSQHSHWVWCMHLCVPYLLRSMLTIILYVYIHCLCIRRILYIRLHPMDCHLQSTPQIICACKQNSFSKFKKCDTWTHISTGHLNECGLGNEHTTVCRANLSRPLDWFFGPISTFYYRFFTKEINFPLQSVRSVRFWESVGSGSDRDPSVDVVWPAKAVRTTPSTVF